MIISWEENQKARGNRGQQTFPSSNPRANMGYFAVEGNSCFDSGVLIGSDTTYEDFFDHVRTHLGISLNNSLYIFPFAPNNKFLNIASRFFFRGCKSRFKTLIIFWITLTRNHFCISGGRWHHRNLDTQNQYFLTTLQAEPSGSLRCSLPWHDPTPCESPFTSFFPHFCCKTIIEYYK